MDKGTVNHVEIESIVNSYDWESYDYGVHRADAEARKVSAAQLRQALLDMLGAGSEEEAQRHYWGIENTAYISGMVFEVSEAVVDCILEAWPVATPEGRAWAMTALDQIACGADAGTYSGASRAGFVDYCLGRLREHLGLLYESLHGPDMGMRWSTSMILPLVEPDASRLLAEFERALVAETAPEVRKNLEDGLTATTHAPGVSTQRDA